MIFLVSCSENLLTIVLMHLQFYPLGPETAFSKPLAAGRLPEYYLVMSHGILAFPHGLKT